MTKTEAITELYDHADKQGYKLKNLNIVERENDKGKYLYTELAYIIPITEPVKTVTAVTDQANTNSTDVQKEEV